MNNGPSFSQDLKIYLPLQICLRFWLRWPSHFLQANSSHLIGQRWEWQTGMFLAEVGPRVEGVELAWTLLCEWKMKTLKTELGTNGIRLISYLKYENMITVKGTKISMKIADHLEAQFWEMSIVKRHWLHVCKWCDTNWLIDCWSNLPDPA